MARWSEFEQSRPTLAKRGRQILYNFGVPLGYLATVRADGGPRVHPFCPAIAQGRLWAFVMANSPKRRDLDANGHFAIHALPGSEDEEFYVAGRAARVQDAAVREAVIAAMPYDDADEQHILYEFSLDRALWTTWENFDQPGTRPVHRVWSPPRGNF